MMFQPHSYRLAPAVRAVVEELEARQLLAGDPSAIRSTPFSLDFDSQRRGVLDKDGQKTGFDWVQPNRNGNEYKPEKINLQPKRGRLQLTTAGTLKTGSNFDKDNRLKNGLQSGFDGRTGTFTIQTTLVGKLSESLFRATQQAGLMFGPNQNNYIKLVAGHFGHGEFLQFIDEQSSDGEINHQIIVNGSFTDIKAFRKITKLKLRLVAEASTGRITAFFGVNNGEMKQLRQQVVLSGEKKDAFFNEASRAGIIAFHKGTRRETKVNFANFSISRKQAPTAASRPTVTDSRPGRGMTDVSRDAFVAADVLLATAGKGIDASTLNDATVKLYRKSDGKLVEAVLNTSGGGDAIVLQPVTLLDPNTEYTFEVTAGLKDLNGVPFLPYETSFTTGTDAESTEGSIAFEQVSLSNAKNRKFTSLTMGPDGKLYAATINGEILRFGIRSDGTLSQAEVIDTIQDNNGGARFLTGIVFDPASTANNLILWASHGEFAFEGAKDWTGKISRLSGSSLQNYQDYVTHLPRSVRDHLNNQISFGPDGSLYFAQGSNTAMGAPDTAWGLRPEHLLNAAVLRLDTDRVAARIANGNGPLNVKTSDGGNYNPFAQNAPLTIYASGVRNAYDMVWHSNGRLYVPTNGSAANGNTPAAQSPFSDGRRIDEATDGPYEGPEVPGIKGVPHTQSDYLFNVKKGGYYGHPNPSRSEYVLNGGNPTSGADDFEVPAYPVGTDPDRNYRGAAYTFGRNYSPNGVIEYDGADFDGKLDGQLMVARYSGGDDIMLLKLAADGSVKSTRQGIAGLTHLVDPLDLVQDTDTGFIYVSEYGASRITLLRPIKPDSSIAVDQKTLYFNDVRSGSASPPQKLVIQNTGSAALAIAADGLSITGTDGDQFEIVSTPSLPATIAPGDFITIEISFAAAGTLGIKTATLNIMSNDKQTPNLKVALRGLCTNGTGGMNEPSLQRIMDLYQIPIVVGDSNPDDVFLDTPPQMPNDEVPLPRLVKAGAGAVTIETLAVFGVSSTPALRLGYYTPGVPSDKAELFTVDKADAQSVNPLPQVATFDPGPLAFGLYTIWPGFGNREVFSEPALNEWEPNPDNRDKIRFYPLKEKDGSVVPNAYVVAVEEFTAGYDYQDVVFIIRNVQPSVQGAEFSIQNIDGLPYNDRLVFNRIESPNSKFPNGVHDTATVRLRNTGTNTITLEDISVTGEWTILRKDELPSTIAQGEFVDVTLRFTATSGAIHFGKLTIATSDSAAPNVEIDLAGFWQSVSEGGQEPNLFELAELFGYTTKFVNDGEKLDSGGKVEAVGEEVLSPYWQRADTARQVTVTQLAAFHTQGQTATLRWHPQGSNSTTTIFQHIGDDGQSIFPRETGTLGAPASGSFTANGAFGFKIDGEWSDPTKNVQEQPGGGFGHHVRFFPLRDRTGKVVPDTYLMVMDYQGINYDYQDNVYIVENIKPA